MKFTSARSLTYNGDMFIEVICCPFSAHQALDDVQAMITETAFSPPLIHLHKYSNDC